jgi:DNA-binding NarL/FixJ family response regulator
MAKTRVLLADDHAVLRAGLRMLINAQADMEVVGEAATSREAMAQAQKLTPNVLVLDLNMPGGGSVKVIERLRQEHPQVRVLVLTMHDDPAYLRAVLAAGGAGYVVKTAADVDLLTAIRAVSRGRTFVDLDLSENNLGQVLGHPAGTTGSAGASPLSPREQEVLGLLAQGHTNREVAERLFLSVKTVETYRARIAEKLGLKTRADIIRYAVELGILAPESFSAQENEP